MKNTKKNVGSFTAAKLQANSLWLLAIIALTAVIGFAMTACNDGGNDSTSCSHTYNWSTASFVDSTETTDGSQGQTCTKCGEAGGSTLVYPAWNKFFGTWDNSAAGGDWIREISKAKYSVDMGENGKYDIENPTFKSSINNNPDTSTAESRAAYPTGIIISGKVSNSTDKYTLDGETSTTMLFLNAADPNKFTDWGTAYAESIFIKQVK